MSRYRRGRELDTPSGCPTEIRIPPYVYPVHYYDSLRDTIDDEELAGCVPEDEDQIWIEYHGQARWRVLSTVLHEARHLYPWPLTLDEDEEKCVRMLDYCEPQLLRHNPTLIDYLRGDVAD